MASGRPGRRPIERERMPDADTYAQLVARYGEETVAAAVLARWSLDPEADDRWAALMGDVERDGFERVCPSCNRDPLRPRLPLERDRSDRLRRLLDVGSLLALTAGSTRVTRRACQMPVRSSSVGKRRAGGLVVDGRRLRLETRELPLEVRDEQVGEVVREARAARRRGAPQGRCGSRGRCRRGPASRARAARSRRRTPCSSRRRPSA